MKKIILTVLITLVIMAGGFLIYIMSGAYDISQLSHHNALTKWVINTTTEHSIDKRKKEIKVPDLSNPQIIINGFKLYNKMCKGCHGAPGMNQSPMTEGLYPKPPAIYKSDDIPEASEAFWIIKNGIKMTSMPAYGPTHNDQEIWAIAAFLSNKLGKMTAEEYKDWSKEYSEKKD
jgi:mono/diheme cytochrome c family protein